MERKKGKKNGSCAAEKEEAAGSLCVAPSAPTNSTDAIITLQIRSGGKYRSDFLFSFLTEEDVCRSYAASIVV